jgi:hypothetical protein
MNEHDEGSKAGSTDDVNGPSARRKFLRQSGRMAVAVPAVVLLLSAGSKNAAADVDIYREPT